jgi:hypothetical protein
VFVYETLLRDGHWVETHPDHCPNGHVLGAGRMIVAYNTAPDGQRRRSWECRSCGQKVWGERG